MTTETQKRLIYLDNYSLRLLLTELLRFNSSINSFYTISKLNKKSKFNITKLLWHLNIKLNDCYIVSDFGVRSAFESLLVLLQDLEQTFYFLYCDFFSFCNPN